MGGAALVSRPGVLAVGFGGPEGPAQLRPFLRGLAADALPLPGALSRVVARRLAARHEAIIRAQYEAVGWSPLVATHREQARALQAHLGPEGPPVRAGMVYGEPSLDDALATLRAQGTDTLVVLPLFPHYSFATTGAAFDRVSALLRGAPDLATRDVAVRYVGPYYDHPRYIDAVAATVRAGMEALPGSGPTVLLFTAHGLPLSQVRKGDPSPAQVERTVALVRERLAWRDPWHVAWQGAGEPGTWLGPPPQEVVAQVGFVGAERLLVVPLSFLGDHLGTRYDLDRALGTIAGDAGIRHFGRAPALDASPDLVAALAEVVQETLAGDAAPRCPSCRADLGGARKCPACGLTTPRWLRQAR